MKFIQTTNPDPHAEVELALYDGEGRDTSLRIIDLGDIYHVNELVPRGGGLIAVEERGTHDELHDAMVEALVRAEVRRVRSEELRR